MQIVLAHGHYALSRRFQTDTYHSEWLPWRRVSWKWTELVVSQKSGDSFSVLLLVQLKVLELNW